ncbi:MAG: RidA family protein [Iamia sp.]
MDEIALLRPEGLVASPSFSHVAVVPPDATMIHIGGQNAVDESSALVSDELAAQVTQVMGNVYVALAAAGATPDDLVSLSILVVDDVDLEAAYAAAAPFLARDADPPLVSVARVAGLALPGALVEVSAIAAMQR